MKSVSIFTFVILASCYSNSTEEKLTLSRKALERGEFKLSIDLVNEILKNDSLNGEAYYLRATCKTKMTGPDEYNDSSDDYLKCVELNFRVSDSYLRLGLNSLSNGNDSVALVYFDKSIQNDSLNGDASFWKILTQKKK